MTGKRKNFYAVEAKGEKMVFSTYEEALEAYNGVSKAKWKGFPTEKEAWAWLGIAAPIAPKYASLDDASASPSTYHGPALDVIYSDSGNSLQSGRPTEVRVTNASGEPIVKEVLPDVPVNERGNVVLPGESNNLGELLGLGLAIKVAQRVGARKVCSDSELVIKWWTDPAGSHIKPSVTAETRALAKLVTEDRRKFEAAGGVVEMISGDINPADLGYHK